MKYSSLDSLEVGSIVGENQEQLFFRCFPSMAGETVMDRTIIVEYKNKKFRVERVIDEECSQMAIMHGSQLWCLGAFGNLYILDKGIWSDYNIELKPYRYLNKFMEINGIMYAAGKNSTLLELNNYKWRKFQGFDEDYDFYSISDSNDKSIYVAGEQGSLYKVAEDRIKVIDVPTNQDFYSIYVNKENIIHLCGSNGCFFVGFQDKWHDLSESDLRVNFHCIKFWNNKILIAAKNKIFKYEDNELKLWVELGAFSLWVTGEVLWAKGLNNIHYFDNGIWKEFIVEFDA